MLPLLYKSTSFTSSSSFFSRYLDANEHHKFLKLVLSDMGECALSVIREAERFDEAFVHSFCISTLEEYSVSPLPKCHFYKVTFPILHVLLWLCLCLSLSYALTVLFCIQFSRQVLSLLFPSKEAKTSLNLKIMMSVLKFVAGEFQVCAKVSCPD